MEFINKKSKKVEFKDIKKGCTTFSATVPNVYYKIKLPAGLAIFTDNSFVTTKAEYVFRNMKKSFCIRFNERFILPITFYLGSKSRDVKPFNNLTMS